MALIDKAALVAKIMNRIKELQNLHKENEDKLDSIQKTAILLCIDECKVILSFLDTLEVEEVDLEKHLKEDIEDVLFDLNGVAVKGATHCLTVEDVKDIAKHFFKLGMAASNKAQKGEEA